MNGLANALVRLACDRFLREKMGTLGRQVIEQRYSIDAVAERHETLYQRLCNESSK